jgi:hypothetical protein
MMFPQHPAPLMARVRQKLDTEHIADVRAYTIERLMAAGLRQRVHPGDRIAITAGSRGMANFTDLLSGIAAAVRDVGGEPFLIPAMGSHGRAEATGQTEILRLLGVNPQTVPAPILATMDTIVLGQTPNGATVHLDRIASEADGIIVLGRTKTHPESAEGLASGLLKMMTIGLGKQRGAAEAHGHGLWESVREAPRLHFGRAKILLGVTMVENAVHQAKIVEIVEPNYDAFVEADERLLRVAAGELATIPFDNLDVLVVDEIGKTVSGCGMDLNVIGHWRATGKGEQNPRIGRIVVLSLTEPSLGNGLGIGLADFTTRRFIDAYDPAATYINLLTATEPGSTTREGPLPLALRSDQEAIEVAVYSSLARGEARVCRIRSTALLQELWVSEALLPEARRHSGLSVESIAEPVRYNPSGNLW